MLQAAVDQVLDRPLDFNAEQFAQALDSDHFVAVRTVVGGVAPAATAASMNSRLFMIDFPCQPTSTVPSS